MRTAIVDDATGKILVLDPPTRDDGSVIPIEGVASHVVTLTAEQEAQLAAAAQVETDAESAAVTAASGLRQQLLDQAQSAVGISLSGLTAVQRNALTACLLWKAGGVTQDMKVKPLGEWVK